MTHPIQNIQHEDVRRPVGHLIVGHASDREATIWIQGAKRFSEATLILRAITVGDAGEMVEERNLPLREAGDYTDSTLFDKLKPETHYEVTAKFRPRSNIDGIGPGLREAKATFTTAPPVDSDDTSPGSGFSFLLGSCNLSVVSINNLCAQALQVLGFAAAAASLGGPISDRKEAPRPKARFGKWWMRRRWRRWVVLQAIKYSLAAIFVGTGGKWPRQPILRSPFLKLEALFAGQEIRFVGGSHRPVPGDVIFSHDSRAFGTLAFAPVLKGGRWKMDSDRDEEEYKRRDSAEGTMVLVDVHGKFGPGDWLRLANGQPKLNDAVGSKVVAKMVEWVEPAPGYRKPAFMIHAGDQIYYDFPDVKRVPEVEGYWSAYRDAWFEDRYQRSFLARGSHYMALDDHEIVDQFSRDCEPLKKEDVPEDWEPADFSADAYRESAMKAYENYVQSRHPKAVIPDPELKNGEPETPRWFMYSHGKAEFFVMDTRTERRRHQDSKMIGDAQMRAFEKWLTDPEHHTALKFVVSSVPFVAEVGNEQRVSNGDDRNDDKWCGAPFRRQRDHIIDFIYENGIDRLVFLVGDMHCAYHASMTIGEGRRWQRRRIHELAGGPISQLDYGRRHQFTSAVRKTTRVETVPYDIRLHQFHGGANAIMHIEVGNSRDQLTKKMVPEVRWRVIRTLTDPAPKWERKVDPANPKAEPVAELRLEDRAPISGRIVFRQIPESDIELEAI